jgi:flagellar biosynthetic protein FliR
MIVGYVLTHAIGFALCVARIAGFVSISPFPTASLTRSQRAGLVVALAWTASYVPTPEFSVESCGLTLLRPALTEVACGLVAGCAFRLLYGAAEAFGHVAAQAIGLSMASVLNPATSSEDVALSRVVTLLAEAVGVGAGLHRVALRYLLHSFRQLPVGGTMHLELSATLLMDLAVHSFAVGVQLAMPVVSVCLIVHLGLAMVARAAPALQILHVGLGLVVVTGVATLLSVLPDVLRGLLEHLESLAQVLDELFSRLAPEPR